MKYDNWQKAILEAEGDILVNTGRQVGKTMTFSHKIAKYMLDHPNHQVIVVSLTEDQAQLIIVMILDYLQRNHKHLIQKGKNKPTKSRIWIKNKARVISRPVGNTGDAVRGFTGNVLYIDEASGMPELMWKAAMPTLATTGGQIWMSSTPRGKFIANSSEKNFFYKSWENPDDRWKVFNTNTKEVYLTREISEDWSEEKRNKALKFLENQEHILTEMEFRQEYLGEFLDDNRQWFEDELIRSCMTEERQDTIKKDGIYFLGVDVARMGEDESTFEIFELRETGHIHQVENQITKKTTLPQTFEHIKSLHSLYDFSKIFIDSEGIGVGVFDWLMFDDDTKGVTEAIDNSRQIMSKDGKTRKLQKTLKYSHAKMMMETGKMHLLDDSNIFQSFKSVQYAYTNDSLGTRHLKIFGNYTHIAEGATNSAWGEKSKHLNLSVYSIKV
tara:strand:+ start:304 stop:1629 length:1326 start_codon:yes stop_codon:yes gene_type:complete